MCFAFDARPPDLPADLVHPRMAGGAGAEKLELTSADGTVFSAALAESADGARGPGVIILPDVRGLYRFYIELAERFAQAGHHAIAIDYFGRTAGTGERDERLRVHAPRRADAARADPGRRRRGPGGARRAHGRDELRDGRLLLRRHAVVPCRDEPGAHARRRGRLLRAPRRRALRDAAPSSTTSARLRCPVLGLFGGADQGIPTSDVDTYDRLSRRPASSTRSSSTPARRTRSSTAPSRSTRARARTPGGA